MRLIKTSIIPGEVVSIMTENNGSFKFPIGYHKFHKNQFFNFPLNRWFALGYAELGDMEEAGKRINTMKDWKCAMVKLADQAISDNRLMNTAFYYRAAELYVSAEDPEKSLLYDRFINLFYVAFKHDRIDRHKVPYENAFLPALMIPAASGRKGVILLHGGFDSFIEEWFSIMKYFSNLGYDVIGFEGPGQGAALRKYGIPLRYEWEKPVKAVLDYFNVDDVTLIGLSMGGWFGLRAAAFESRIKRVIASGHAIDYMKSMNYIFRKIHLWCYTHCRDFMVRMAVMKMRKEGIFSWTVKHLMYITKREKPMDALEIYLLMNEKNIHSELVKQDVLILTGREDHLIPFKMHDMQINALINARSVTGRVFTKREHAQNHCQTGNIGLALDVMENWIKEKSL